MNQGSRVATLESSHSDQLWADWSQTGIDDASSSDSPATSFRRVQHKPRSDGSKLGELRLNPF